MPLPPRSRLDRLVRLAHPALFALVPTLLVLTAISHRDLAARRSAFPVEEDLVYLPRASVLRAMSLGHPEVMADFVFLRTITYFGAQLTGQKNFDWLERHIDTVNALDPHFRAPYSFGGHVAMYNGLAITNREVRMSSHFLEAGLKIFPTDWELAFMLGCNYMFELKTDDPRQKDAWRRTGGEWIRRAAIAGGGPPWLPGLAATIMSKEGEVDAALRYLEEAYLTAPDDRTRDEVGRLLLAKRRSAADSLTAARASFIESWKRTLPYAPADLYVIVGEPPSPRLDWRWLVSNLAIEKALAGASSDEAATSGAPK